LANISDNSGIIYSTSCCFNFFSVEHNNYFPCN